jgi:CDP-diacylglycerol--glycerol-3-phosphate 3-phosphatidyltransferase
VISALRKYVDPKWKIFGLLSFLPPNAWSLIHLIIVAVSAVFYFRGEFFWGGILFFFGSALDFVDGSVARYTNKPTKFGAIFDATIDRTSEGLIYIALSQYFIAAPVALVCSYLVSYIRAKDDRIKVGIAESGERIFILTIASLTGFVEAGLWIIAVLAGITALMRLNEAKKLHE